MQSVKTQFQKQRDTVLVVGLALVVVVLYSWWGSTVLDQRQVSTLSTSQTQVAAR